MQHSNRQGVDRRMQWREVLNSPRAGVKSSEIDQRVLQQGIVALEVLDELFLQINGRCQPVHCCCRPAVRDGNAAQTRQQLMQRIRLLNQWIVVAQRAGPRTEHVPGQRGFHHCKFIEQAQRAIIDLRVGIDGAPRQPCEQREEDEHRRRGSGELHGGATTGTPR